MRPKKNLRVAIAGAGLMGRWHAHYARKAGARIAAVIDSNAAAGHALKAKTHTAAVFQDLQQCLASVQIDVVHICTPSTTHSSLSRISLENGAHVLVEKPGAGSIREAEELVQLAAARGLKINPVHQFPFQNGFMKLLKTQNQLGAPVQVALEICTAGGVNKSSLERRAILVEMVPHAISLFTRLLGSSAFDKLRAVPQHGEDELEIHGVVGGATVRAFFTHRGRPARNDLTYTGTVDTAHVDLFHGYCFTERGSTSRTSKALRPLKNGLSAFSTASINLAARAIRSEWAYPGLGELIARFYRAVREDLTPPVSAEEFIEAARLSSECAVKF